MNAVDAACVRAGRATPRRALGRARNPQRIAACAPRSCWYERCNRLPAMAVSSRSKLPRGLQRLLVETRGDAAVEYVLLFGLVALPAIPAFVAAGAALVQTFEVMRDLSVLPVP